MPKFAYIHPGLTKAQYAVGYFSEMGIGTRRDPLDANAWYVKAADQGDERAKHRLAAIRVAAAGGVEQQQMASPGKNKARRGDLTATKTNKSSENVTQGLLQNDANGDSKQKGKKKFGLF